LEKPERFASARLYHDMIAEMVLAFCCVSFLHFGIILHDFVVATPPKIAARYAWIAPMGLWLFTTAWMATYTMHIPFVYQRDWQWGLTAFFIILNLLVTCGLKVRWVGFFFSSHYCVGIPNCLVSNLHFVAAGEA
jgi:hypothetical protein